MAGSTNGGGFRARVDGVLASRYHDRHPFHQRMHNGSLSREELQDWVLNRFYYQRIMPVKDALVLAKLPSSEARRQWITRIVDQDGTDTNPGGLDSWLRLADAVGLGRESVLDDGNVAPGVRFAVDAYVNFCRLSSWEECVAATLTQLAVPELMRRRSEALRRHYPWVAADGLDYFQRHQTQAAAESASALKLLSEGLSSPEGYDSAVSAVAFKCDVLWAMLDAIDGVR